MPLTLELIFIYDEIMLSGKKLLLLGFIVVLLVVIPLTVYLVQQQQKLKAGATPATNMSILPASSNVNVGDTVKLNVQMNPGTNQVSFVKLTVTFDPNKLTPLAPLGSDCPSHTDYVGICPQGSFQTVLQPPTLDSSSSSISITMSVGQSPNGASAGNIALLEFKAKADTGGSTTQVALDTSGNPPNTQVLSIASGDQFNENVLAGTTPALLTIATTTTSPSPSANVSPSPSGSGTPNVIPVCTSLVADRTTTGTAPYALTFTATGTDSDGTVSKVTFQFGDGGTTDVTTGGGIGTASVNVQASHQYNNPGTFTAKAILTDNQNGVSNGSCTLAVTINAATGGGNSTTQTVTVSPTPSVVPTVTPIAIATPAVTPIPSLAPTGPGDKFVSFGSLGVVSTIIGAIILFAL